METYKVLAQSDPAVATLTAVYTVPGSTSAVISSIVAAERNGVADAIRISIAVAGAADTPAQYIAFDFALAANDVATFTLGITLAATDVVRIFSTTGDTSFNVFGVEVT